MIGWSIVKEVFLRKIAVWKIDHIISISLDLIIFLPMFIFYFVMLPNTFKQNFSSNFPHFVIPVLICYSTQFVTMPCFDLQIIKLTQFVITVLWFVSWKSHHNLQQHIPLIYINSVTPEIYSEPCQTSKMKRFTKTANVS